MIPLVPLIFGGIAATVGKLVTVSVLGQVGKKASEDLEEKCPLPTIEQEQITETSASDGDGPEGQSKIFEGMVIDRRYRILKMLGRGAMGSVYEVEDITLGDPHLAMKFFSPIKGDAVGRLRARFDREARVLYKISQELTHESVCLPRVQTYGPNPEGIPPYYVMDMIVGPGGTVCTLDDVRDKEQDIFTLEQIEIWFEDVCKALYTLHQHGCLHRDIKPENIMIDAHGHAVISDFGTAKISAEDGVASESESLTLVGRFEREQVGTRRYWSPELRDGAEATVASDIYALAATFWKVIFDDDYKASNYPPGNEYFEDLDEFGEKWRRVLVKMLAPNPADRPVSAEGCWKLYKGDSSGGEGLAARTSAFRRWGVAVAATMVIVCLIWVVLVLKRRTRDLPLSGFVQKGDTPMFATDEPLANASLQRNEVVSHAFVGRMPNERFPFSVECRLLLKVSIDIAAYTNAMNGIQHVLESKYRLKPERFDMEVEIRRGEREGDIADSVEGDIIDRGFRGGFEPVDVGSVDDRKVFKELKTEHPFVAVVLPVDDVDGVRSYKAVRYRLSSSAEAWLRILLQEGVRAKNLFWLRFRDVNRKVIFETPIWGGDEVRTVVLQDICTIENIDSGKYGVVITPWLRHGSVETSYTWISKNISAEVFKKLDSVELEVKRNAP